MIITAQMIRDNLALKGPMSLTELSQSCKVDKNTVQALLLDLATAGDAFYDYDSGVWATDLVLE